MTEFFEWYRGFFGEELTDLVITLWIVTLVFSVVVGIVSYVFSSVSVFTIAKRRGIRAYWLAWIPFGWTWLFGSIADQFECRRKGRDKRYRIGLLIGDIVASAAMITGIVMLFTAFFSVFRQTMFGDPDEMSVLTEFMKAMLWFYLLTVPALVFSIFYYIAMYRVYKSCSPKSAVWLLLLAIIFNLCGLEQSIPLFCLRKKDDGLIEAEPDPKAEPQGLELYN